MPRSHALLDVVSEDPESPHVPDDVHPAAVEEHAGQERPVVVDGEPCPLRPRRVAIAGRHDAEEVEEALERLGIERQLVEEHEGIDRPRS